MNDVREKISDVLEAFEYEYMENAYPRATDEIIAIFREALLDPDVIAKGGQGCPPPVQVDRVVRNVLDAAGFGESGDE